MITFFLFFFNDTATTEIYTLSLHDALPIFAHSGGALDRSAGTKERAALSGHVRSEEHTSELQSLAYLVCRLLLEKKNHSCTTRRRRAGISSPRADGPVETGASGPAIHSPRP